MRGETARGQRWKRCDHEERGQEQRKRRGIMGRGGKKYVWKDKICCERRRKKRMKKKKGKDERRKGE